MAKIKAQDLYYYVIIPATDLVAKKEHGDNRNPFSNWKKPLTIKYDDVVDGMTIQKFHSILSTPGGQAQMAMLRMQSPVIVFIESDGIALNMFPQYNLN